MSALLPYGFSGSVKGIARVVLKGVSGEKRIGGHALTIRGTFETIPMDTVSIAEVGGHVAGLGELERYSLVPHQLLQPIVLGLPLTRDQLRGLEEARLTAGGELDLTVRIKTPAHGPLGLQMSWVDTTLRLGGAAWSSALAELDYADTVGFDVAVPRAPDFPELAPARAPYARACARLRSGDHHGVVAACREVLEALAKSQAMPQPPPPAEWAGKNDKAKWTLDQRVAFIAAAVRHLAHVAHHPTSGRVARDVAQMTIVQTSLLLRATYDRLRGDT